MVKAKKHSIVSTSAPLGSFIWKSTPFFPLPFKREGELYIREATAPL